MYKNKMTNSYMTDSEYMDMMRRDARFEWICMDDDDKADFESYDEFELVFVERFPDADWEGFDPDSTTFAEFISGCVVPDDYAWAGNFDGISDIVWTEEKDSDEGPIRFGYGVAEIDITGDQTFELLEEDVDAGTAVVNWEDVPTLITDWQNSFDDVYFIVEVENNPTCRAVPCRRDQNFYLSKVEALAALQELLPKTSTGLRIFDTCLVDGERYAILVDEASKLAYEAVWDAQTETWETDFNFPDGVSSFDVAGELDFDGCREAGYTFDI